MIGGCIGGSLAAIMLAMLSPLVPVFAPMPLFVLASPAPSAPTSPSPSSAPAAPVISPEIASLISRHNRAIGGMPYIAASWNGVIDQGGAQSTYAAIADIHGRYRIVYKLPFGDRSEGSDGVLSWTQDINGNVLSEPLQHPRSVASRLLGYNAAFFDRYLPWTLDGTTALDGRQVYKLRTKLGHVDATFYVDAQNALLDGVDVEQRTIRYPVYGRFESMSLPTKIVDTEDGDTITLTVADVKESAPALATYAAPASRHPDFPALRSDVEMDFEAPHSLIVVGATINGVREKFLIDSGSSSSLIDLDEAKRLKLPLAGNAHVAGARLLGGTAARADNLDIGGIQFHPFVFEAVPIGLPVSIQGYGIEGILGFDVLAQLVARIDYGRARLQLIAPDSFKYAGTGAVIALDPITRVPRIPATLGQSDAVTFVVDTGSDSGLIVYRDFASAHLNDFMRPGDLASDACPLGCGSDVSAFFGDLTQANGAGGSIHVRTSFVTRIGLGNFSVNKVFTEIVLQPTGAFVPTQADGLVGARVLSQFGAVFLDYPGHRFILER